MEFVRDPTPSAAKVTVLKLLLSHEQCGALIGRGGSTILQLQRNHGIAMRLGCADEVFPGTSCRAGLLKGPTLGVQAAWLDIVCILSHDHVERTRQRSDFSRGFAALSFCLMLLVPEASAGAVLGPAGQTIRYLTAETGASIRLSTVEEHVLPVGERIVSFSGAQESVLKACSIVFELLAAEARNLVYGNPTVVYPSIIPPRYLPAAEQPPPHWGQAPQHAYPQSDHPAAAAASAAQPFLRSTTPPGAVAAGGLTLRSAGYALGQSFVPLPPASAAPAQPYSAPHYQYQHAAPAQRRESPQPHLIQYYLQQQQDGGHHPQAQQQHYQHQPVAPPLPPPQYFSRGQGSPAAMTAQQLQEQRQQQLQHQQQQQQAAFALQHQHHQLPHQAKPALFVDTLAFGTEARAASSQGSPYQLAPSARSLSSAHPTDSRSFDVAVLRVALGDGGFPRAPAAPSPSTTLSLPCLTESSMDWPAEELSSRGSGGGSVGFYSYCRASGACSVASTSSRKDSAEYDPPCAPRSVLGNLGSLSFGTLLREGVGGPLPAVVAASASEALDFAHLPSSMLDFRWDAEQDAHGAPATTTTSPANRAEGTSCAASLTWESLGLPRALYSSRGSWGSSDSAGSSVSGSR